MCLCVYLCVRGVCYVSRSKVCAMLVTGLCVCVCKVCAMSVTVKCVLLCMYVCAMSVASPCVFVCVCNVCAMSVANILRHQSLYFVSITHEYLIPDQQSL